MIRKKKRRVFKEGEREGRKKRERKGKEERKKAGQKIIFQDGRNRSISLITKQRKEVVMRTRESLRRKQEKV